jgi:glycosyltransferase involved in cell wall biosynthesis
MTNSIQDRDRPIVSVVIPTYNRCALLRETLDSVCAQTVSHWEAIVVDDGSTDGTADMMATLSSGDARIRFQRRTGEQRGAPVCRNQGMDAAQGEYVIFLDSDDLLHPRCLEGRVAIMAANPTLDFVTYPAELFAETPGDLGVMWNAFSTEDDLDRYLRHDAPWQTTGPMWRRQYLTNHQRRWDEKAPSWQDWEYHVKALLNPVTYAKVNFPDNYVRRSGADTNAISQNDGVPDHLLDRSRLFLDIVDRLLQTESIDPKHSVYIQAMVHRNNLLLIRGHGLVGPAIEVWRQCYKKGLIHSVRYFEGWIAYRLFSVALFSNFALRWMDMRWLDYHSTGTLKLTRTILTNAHAYLDDPEAYAKSLPHVVRASRNVAE